MRETRVLFGVAYDKDAFPITSGEARRAIGMIQEYAAENFGGATMYRHEGAWKDGKGRMLSEAGVTLSVFGIALPEQETALAEFVRRTFRQESVVLVRRTGEAEFIG